MGRKVPPPPSAAPAAPFHPAFASLGARLAEGGAAPPPAAAAPPSARPAALPGAAPPPPARAVVRMERAGRAGKTVTVVEKLGLPPGELARWQGELRRALGCGGAVERDHLVVQGDLRERVAAWLTARGVRKVTVG